MTTRLEPQGSLWLANEPELPATPPLTSHVSAEIAVVGGGIVGVTCAYLLASRGCDVVLVEARRIGTGTTGNTTAKLSSLHGLKYASLRRKVGTESAAAYGALSELGLQRVRDLTAALGIECDLRERVNFTYALEDRELGDLEAEVDAASSLGLPASFAPEVDLPFATAGAVSFAGQAEFQPHRYLVGLLDAARDEGLRVHEGSRATRIREGAPAAVELEQGEIQADRVILATHLPFTDRGLFFARTRPSHSYAIAVRVPGDLPGGMYLSTEKKPHSIRTASDEGGELLIVGGEGHKTGQGDARKSYGALRDFARVHWEASEPDYEWSSHDPVSSDGLPMIGGIRPGAHSVLTATAFSKWGLAAGTEAAAILADACGGAEHELAGAFDPWHRARGIAVSLPSVAKEGIDFTERFVADRLHPQGDDPPPGSGAVLGRAPHQRAVYTDEDGTRHELSARCTHLGCIVKWNDGDKSWDCPCHGSRFDPLGEVIQGPAVKGLEDKTP